MSQPWAPGGFGDDPFQRAPATFDPDTIDPKDPAFREDPYYALFRRHAPVCLVRHGSYQSYWVFTHALVDEVNRETATFLKEPVSKTGPRGLFFMDPPRHTEVRCLLDPMFAQATADAADLADRMTVEALRDIMAAGRTFDATTALANRVMRNVFMATYGVPPRHWKLVGWLVDTMLGHYDNMLPFYQRVPGFLAAAGLLAYFGRLAKGCPMHTSPKGLFGRIVTEGGRAGMSPSEITQTSLHFALGGYLSTQFLITTGLHNLLTTPGAYQTFLTDPGVRLNAIEEMKRHDAPFQVADRYAAKDTRLGGCEIPAGSRLTVIYGSANHDADVFGASAERFDIHREPLPAQNRVFGNGPHRCIGAGLVADVMPVILGRIVETLPTLALGDAAPVRETDPYFRGFKRLPLTT
jgi:cytochrome P450